MLHTKSRVCAKEKKSVCFLLEKYVLHKIFIIIVLNLKVCAKKKIKVCATVKKMCVLHSQKVCAT